MWAEILKKTIGYCILYLVFLGILKYWNFSFAHVWYQLSMNYKTMKYRYLEICTFMDYWRGLSVLKLRETEFESPLNLVFLSFDPFSTHSLPFPRVEILTSNSVGTQGFFLGCNQDNNRGYNFITKKKICLVHQKRKLATTEINKFII